MSNKKLWNKLAAVTVVSAMIMAAAGCGTTQTGAMTQDQVEDAAVEASQIEAAIEESAAAEDTAFENTEEASAVEIPPADISEVKIDYKTSEIYSKEDMDGAIEKILDEFGSWDGCVLYTISYTDDTTCTDNLSYVRELDSEKDYKQCIVFTSNFHSPVVEYGAWEPDYDYNNYQWILGRTEGGEWDLLTWGY